MRGPSPVHSPGRASNGRREPTEVRRIDRPPSVAPSAGQRPQVRIELIGLAALLLLTGAFGRSFSKLELGVPWLHLTEVMLVAILVTALARTPAREWVGRIRRTGVLVPLSIFWIVGSVALVRGLASWGFSPVLHDIGLVEYSVLLPLVALLVLDRSAFVWMCRVVALAGLLGIVALAASTWTPADWDLSSRLNLIAAASGMYAALYVAWIVARRAAGLTVATWQYATVTAAAGLIVIGSARSAWLTLLIVFVCAAAFCVPRRRLAFAAQMAGLLVLGTAMATAAQEAQTIEIPSPSSTATELLATVEVGELNSAVVGPAEIVETPGAARRSERSALAPAGAEAARATAQDPRAGDVPDSLFVNPGIAARNTRGYAGFAPNTLRATADRASSGPYSLEAGFNGDPRLAKTLTYLPLDPATRYLASATIYIPQAWDGGAISVSTDRTWAGATEKRAGSSTTTAGEWTRIHTAFAPEGRDLVGGIHIRTTDAPSAGSEIYIDDVAVEPIEGPAGPASSGAVDRRASGDPGPAQPGKASVASADPSAAPEPDASGLAELTASFRPSSERANAQWRLAFWRFIVDQTAKRPLWGLGFGAPSNFEWNGVRYDSRTGDPKDPFDVTGPHNSFLNVLYRTGLAGFVALWAIVLIAVARTVPVVRRASGSDKAIAIWLVAAIAATTVSASLNVALEGPFMGIFFWTILGLALVAPQFIGRAPDVTAVRAARHQTYGR